MLTWEDADLKKSIYALRENFVNDQMCLLSFIAPHINFSITYVSGVKFQINNILSGVWFWD